MTSSRKTIPSSANGGPGLQNLFQRAVSSGTLSAQTSSLITGNLGNMVLAGAAGMATEDISASEVTLMTLIIDKSSSIAGGGLAAAIRQGQKDLLEAMRQSKEKDAILVALWTFHHEQDVLHSYVPVEDATVLDTHNYRPDGTTHLYDTWCDALAANVAYAQRLRDAGTPCRSIVVVLTDGYDVGSTRSAKTCKKLSVDLLSSEQFVLAFVGVGKDADFKRVAKEMGVPDGSVLVQNQASASAIRQVFRMVSQSAIRASQGLIAPGPQAGFFSP